MKKDRNSFFSEYNMSAYNNMQPMMPNMMPNQVSSQSSFYSGPAMNNMMPDGMQNQYTGQNNYTNDLESRISKIERQLNRIETRLSKLESGINYTTDKDLNDNVYNTNMYMV